MFICGVAGEWLQHGHELAMVLLWRCSAYALVLQWFCYGSGRDSGTVLHMFLVVLSLWFVNICPQARVFQKHCNRVTL